MSIMHIGFMRFIFMYKSSLFQQKGQSPETMVFSSPEQGILSQNLEL